MYFPAATAANNPSTPRIDTPVTFITPVRILTIIGWREVLAMNCSSRVYSSLTGRLVAMIRRFCPPRAPRPARRWQRGLMSCL